MLSAFRQNRTLVIMAAAVILYLASATLTWRGLGDWDALHYINGAFNWYETGLFLGDNHWHLRYPMVVPIAGSFAIFGPSEWAATLPNLAYAIALIVISTIWGLRYLGPAAGTCFALLVATSPALVLQPLEIEIRGPEIFFSALALWLFLTGMDRDKGANRLILAGVAAGAAWLCREVAGYLLPTFVLAGLLFAPKGRRWPSMTIPALSFLAVLVVELAVYWLAAGDPLYRYKIDLGHGANIPGTEFAGDLDNGLLAVLVEPLKQHLTDPASAPFIVAGGLAAIVALFGYQRLGPYAMRALGVFATGVAASYLLSSLVLNLEKPNYFPLLNYLALMLIASVIGLVWRSGHKLFAAASMVALCLAGPFFAGLGERYEYDYYRYAAELAKTEQEPVVTSFRVRERGKLLLRLEGWAAEDAANEFASGAQPRNGRIAFRPGYSWFVVNFVLGDEWILQDEWYPSDLIWQHKLLQALGQMVPLPPALARMTTPPAADLLTRDGTSP